MALSYDLLYFCLPAGRIMELCVIVILQMGFKKIILLLMGKTFKTKSQYFMLIQLHQSQYKFISIFQNFQS